MKYLHKIAFLLLIVGGLNWGALAVFNWDIGMIFGGGDAMISKIIYILVALSAVYLLFTHKKECKECTAKSDSAAM